MPISGQAQIFSHGAVDASPDTAGVYALFEGSQVIYFGSSSTSVRDRLQRHLNGDAGGCTQNATMFKVEVSKYPLTREKELLQEHKSSFGRLPRCNDVIP